MKNQTARVCVYPKDVQRITGKSERYGRMLILKIKKEFNKKDHQFVSLHEFCTYTGLKQDHLHDFFV